MHEVLSDRYRRKIAEPRSNSRNDISGLLPLQQSLVIGIYVTMLVHEVLSDRYRRKIAEPRSKNRNDISGLFSLQQSLVIGSYV